jgi:hypothetical protein
MKYIVCLCRHLCPDYHCQWDGLIVGGAQMVVHTMEYVYARLTVPFTRLSGMLATLPGFHVTVATITLKATSAQSVCLLGEGKPLTGPGPQHGSNGKG